MAKKTSKAAAAKAPKPAARKRKPAASKSRERTYRVRLSCYFKNIGKPGQVIEVGEADLRQLLDGRGAVLVRDDEPIGRRAAKPEPAEVDDAANDDDGEPAGDDDSEDTGEAAPEDDVDTSGLA